MRIMSEEFPHFVKINEYEIIEPHQIESISISKSDKSPCWIRFLSGNVIMLEKKEAENFLHWLLSISVEDDNAGNPIPILKFKDITDERF